MVNLERTERGLAPAVVLSKSLTAVAQAGAQAGRDPAMGPTTRIFTWPKAMKLLGIR